eukprot:gene15585-17467_t
MTEDNNVVIIRIAGHNNFPCPVGRTVEETGDAIRSRYGLRNGGINLRNVS